MKTEGTRKLFVDIIATLSEKKPETIAQQDGRGRRTAKSDGAD
jgi:hypothetical protein